MRFHLHGLSSAVLNSSYSEVGLKVMNEMWRVVKESRTATTGINHWVYLPDNAFYQRPSADKRRQGQVRGNSVFESPATSQNNGFNFIEVPCDPNVFSSQFYDTSPHPAWPSRIRLVPIERSTFSSIVSLPKNQPRAAVRQRFAAVCSASKQLAKWHTRCLASEAANPVAPTPIENLVIRERTHDL